MTLIYNFPSVKQTSSRLDRYNFNPDSASGHRWVEVLNPMDNTEVLRACDCCGVVQSVNSQRKPCPKPGQIGLISASDLRQISVSA